jgi:hypothetical protein
MIDPVIAVSVFLYLLVGLAIASILKDTGAPNWVRAMTLLLWPIVTAVVSAIWCVYIITTLFKD